MEKRVLLLADSASPHTEKWAVGLAKKGFTVGLFSLNKTNNHWYKNYENIFLLNEPSGFSNAELLFTKLQYVFVLPRLLRAIKNFRPSIVHAHYGTSYGLLGSLSTFSPFILSLWGSDVFEFPKKSFFHAQLLKYNLKKADQLVATSFALKGELWKYTKKDVRVIPFGVDTGVFYPRQIKPASEKDTVNIGAIKALEDKYGIKTILEAFTIVKQKLPNESIKLFLVGGGNADYYKSMAENMGIADLVTFTGKIDFKKISNYHNLLDIFLNVSIVDESFGVSVIEAMACQKPVIVTNAPGLLEIVADKNDIAIVVKKDHAEELSAAIIKLILSPDLRWTMGKKASAHVLENYDFAGNLREMIEIYQAFLPKEEKLVLNMT